VYVRDKVGLGNRLSLCTCEIAAEVVLIVENLPEGRRSKRFCRNIAAIVSWAGRGR
jgi:hypothetical protein